MLVNNQYSRAVQKYSSNSKSDMSNVSTEIPFADKLKGALSETEAKDFQPTDSIGIVIRQMRINGEASKEVEHNGVKISFHYDEKKGAKITIGESDPKGNWKSIKTKDGVVRFNLNDPESIMKCLDLFTPEEIKQIMMMLALEKKVQETEKEVEEAAGEAVEEMQSQRSSQSEENDKVE